MATAADILTAVDGYTALAPEQRHAIDLAVFKQQHLFVTGPGGTGKSYFLEVYQRINQRLAYPHGQRRVAVCAMTGCAAVLLGNGATTLHSWSGIGIDHSNPAAIVDKIRKNGKLRKQWQETDVLVIDEISMMPASLLSLLDSIGRAVRKDPGSGGKPFGGLQLVLLGDFFQLPPVARHSAFCFESEVWQQLFANEKKNVVQLTRVFRQTDRRYVDLLNHLRQGELTEDDCALLQSRVDQVYDASLHHGVALTQLFPTRQQVERVNQASYDALPTTEVSFRCSVVTNATARLDGSNKKLTAAELTSARFLTAAAVEEEWRNLLSKQEWTEFLRLKIGATVMCTSNLDVENGICNGAQGTVVSLQGGQPLVQFRNGVVKAMPLQYRHSAKYPTIAVGQYPLCWAWAVTIHKIQGASLDCAQMDLGERVFEFGQSYVALSRVRSLDGLFLNSFDASKAQAHPTVCAYYASLLTETTTTTEAMTEATTVTASVTGHGHLKQTVFKKRSLVEPELEEQELEQGEQGEQGKQGKQEQVPKKRNEDSSLSTPYVYVKKINL